MVVLLKGTPSSAETQPAIVVSDVEIEVSTGPLNPEWSLNVRSPYVAASSPSMSLDPSTGIATQAGVIINHVPDLVQLSAFDVAIEFTDDASLLNALPCWSDAEIIQQWDLEWERSQGNPEWLRRGELRELP